MALEKDFFFQAAISLFLLFYLIGFGLTLINANLLQANTENMNNLLEQQALEKQLGTGNQFYSNIASYYSTGLLEFATPVMVAVQAFNEGFIHGYYFQNQWSLQASNYFIELIPFFALKAFGLILLALLSIELFYFIVIIVAKVMLKEIYRQEAYLLKQPFSKMDLMILLFALILIFLSALIKPFTETFLQSSVASFNNLFYPIDFLILAGLAAIMLITGFNAIQKLLAEANALKKPID